MIDTKIYNPKNIPTDLEKNKIVNFFHTHLGEYGDSKKDILKAINYSLKSFTSFGGFVMLLTQENKILAGTVINKTGMGGYIPENILVYITTNNKYRGKGIGKMLMQKAIKHAKGDIALHVEPNNPAKHLYEKLGFTNPYLEMRLKK